MRPTHPSWQLHPPSTACVAPWGAPPTDPVLPPACVPLTQCSASWSHRELHRRRYSQLRHPKLHMVGFVAMLFCITTTTTTTRTPPYYHD
eukprot:3982247-Pyramimonas_sp.AAC.1